MILVRNKRASYDYQLTDKLTAGLVLYGWEVKSLKASQASLVSSFVDIASGEAWLMNAFIGPYQNQQAANESRRKRKLLLNRSEILSLQSARQQGKHVIPMAFKTLNGRIKIDLGVGNSRRKADKREYLKAREDKKQSRLIKDKHGRFSTG